MERPSETAQIVLLTLAAAFASNDAAAQAPPDTEYGVFAPVTIDPPASPASPPSDAPPSDSAPVAQPEPEETSVIAPAPAPEPDPDDPEPTLANLDRKRQADMPSIRYGVGKGVTIASANGRYSLQVRARLQIRYDLDHPNFEDEPLTHVFQVRRARVVLAGNVFSPYIRYQFQFGFSPRDMSNDIPSDLEDSIRRNPLRDARIELTRLRGFNVWLGQYKVPFSRQRVISSSNLSILDRSLVNADFNLDRDLGISARSTELGKNDELAYYVGVFMGEGRNAFESRDPGLLYVARLEIRPFGAFDDYTEGDVFRSDEPGLSIGAAYAFQDRAHAARGVGGEPPADGGTTNFHHFTADALFKWSGLFLFTGFHLRQGFDRVNGGALDDDGVPIATVPARSGIGWFGQFGVMMPVIPLELTGRYGMTRRIFGDESSQPDSDEVGGGLSWYFVGHDLKLQADYFRLWDDSLGATYAEQAKHGTDRIRVQVQLHF